MQHVKTNLIWGTFLIIIGILFLIGNLSHVSMEILWPFFPMIIGLGFLIGFLYDRKNYGLLMPGSILLIIGLLFFYCAVVGWYHMEILWPVFILAPAVGFLAMYFGGKRERGLLVPAGVLSALGVFFFLLSSGLDDYWPVFLIIAGVLLIILHGSKEKERVKKMD